MNMSEKLLVLAFEWAEVSAQGWTIHRRAVSTAYYAVFHALARLCAGEFVGKGRDAQGSKN